MADNETNRLEPAEKKEKLKKKLKELNAILAEQTGRLNHLQSSGFQLANFYFVFQGVILTVISNGASALRCSKRWIPLALSLLAAILNLVSFVKIGLEYLETLKQRDNSLMKIDQKYTKLVDDFKTPANPSKDQPSHSKKEDQPSHSKKEDQPFDDAYKKFKRKCSFVSCVLLFLVFSGIMLAACWTVICHRVAESKHRQNFNGKCIRLCDSSNCIRICSE